VDPAHHILDLRGRVCWRRLLSYETCQWPADAGGAPSPWISAAPHCAEAFWEPWVGRGRCSRRRNQSSSTFPGYQRRAQLESRGARSLCQFAHL